MNEQQLVAVKQAMEALKEVAARTGPRWALEQGYAGHLEAITALQSIISQDALYKMAEESRTSGLRLDDWDKIGCVNHDCDKCKAVQEPVAWPCVIAEADFEQNTITLEMKCSDYKVGAGQHWLHTTPPAPQPVPVKTYHDGKPWPVAPKPWVGLSEEEVYEAAHYCVKSGQSVNETIRAIEAKLKRKNT
jgi:hypothetical protein